MGRAGRPEVIGAAGNCFFAHLCLENESYCYFADLVELYLDDYFKVGVGNFPTVNCFAFPLLKSAPSVAATISCLIIFDVGQNACRSKINYKR